LEKTFPAKYALHSAFHHYLTANKTEKREKQLAIGNGGRYAGNEQLAVSNEQ
jgi:hypothetical protein